MILRLFGGSQSDGRSSLAPPWQWVNLTGVELIHYQAFIWMGWTCYFGPRAWNVCWSCGITPMHLGAEEEKTVASALTPPLHKRCPTSMREEQDSRSPPNTPSNRRTQRCRSRATAGKHSEDVVAAAARTRKPYSTHGSDHCRIVVQIMYF